MDKYSVLMSLYSKEEPEYLIQAINSMIDQTVFPDEIVIVKDGPLTDALEHVLADYQKRYPELFNIISSDVNIGLGKALNFGLQYCRNELIARMDTDDISFPQRCEKQLNLFSKKKDLALVGSYIDEFNGTPSNIISTRRVPIEYKDIYEFAKRRSAFNHPTVMYKKSKVLALGGYRAQRRNQDVDLFGRMLFAGYIAENIGEPLLFFRVNDALAKRRKSWENTKSYISTIFRFWKIGYSDFWDICFVFLAQIIMFIMPVKFQNWAYKHYLRK